MAKRKPTPIIPSFPPEIDRHYFATWISGFTDGEGCFILAEEKKTARPYAQFVIMLRLDDLPILRLVRSFFSSGCLYLCPARNASKPKAQFAIYRVADLATKVVPHFENFPLMAKKKKDFAIWKQGVLLAHHVCQRGRRGRGNGGGSYPHWAESEREEMRKLIRELQAVRSYDPETIFSIE